ncbi:MAG: class I SAM-dependent methyltransferase [Deltaproteobacteria bacterium]|nr:class I SAM-dependent methyltransferase [Deltaproteobacteria bacterium]
MQHDPIKTKYEYLKHNNLRPQYESGLNGILGMDISKQDLIHHFPAFIGHQTLARQITLYEAYKMTLNVAGHIAEVGVNLGFGSLLFAKLTKIFEPNSLTLVHGFDWCQGAEPTAEEEHVIARGSYCTPEHKIREIVKVQGLENIVHLHNLDASKDLPSFFKDNNHLQFKLVFLDCGLYDVVSECLKHFWNRITPGGVLILDHYSFELAPGEMRAIRDVLPHVKWKQFPFGWMPCAYAVKE